MSDDVIGIHDLNIRSVNDVACSQFACPALSNTDVNDLGICMDLCSDPLDIEDDFRHVLDNAGNCGKLVADSVNLNRCNCRTSKR